MKTHLQHFRRITITVLLTLFISFVQSQNLYVLNFSNPSNYYVTCGSVTSSQWAVKDLYCSLITSEVFFPGNPLLDSAMVATVTISFKSTGNVDCNEIFPDGAFIRYSINNSPWFIQSSINSCTFNRNTYTIAFQIQAPAGASIKLMVSIVTTSKTEKIWITDGGIVIGKPVVANDNTWVKKMEDTPPSLLPTEQNALAFSVFPNPLNEQDFKIQVHNAKDEKVLVVLYDLMGREIFSKELIVYNGDFLEIVNTDNKLKKGIYLIIGTNKNEIYKETLVVR